MDQTTVEFSKTNAVDIGKKAATRVLHVDDDAGFLKTAKHILEMQGAFQVDTASSVDEAMEKMKTESYDAVVCDYQMRGKDGLQFLKELRQKENKIPFVIFTGKGREEIAIKALNLGADGYFTKTGQPETVYGELAHGILQVVEKRRGEQLLLKSEDKYRRLVETLHEGIWAIDKDSYTTFVNPRMAEILGYGIEEMMGKHLFSFMDERGVEIAKRLLERRGRGIVEQHDFEFIRKDGERVYATLETSPITDDNGNYVGALASVMDTTERRKAEELLKESEQKCASLVESAPDGILAVDSKGNVISVNASFLRLIGCESEEEILGKPFTDIVTIQVQDIPRFAEMFSSVIKGKSFPPTEFSYVRRDGTSRWVEVHPGLVMRDGKPVGVQVIMRDATERKKVAQEILIRDKALSSSIDAMAIAGLQGNLTYVNAAFLNMWGYDSIEEVLGKPNTKFWQSEEKAGEVIEALETKGRWTGELTATRKDGSPFCVNLAASMVKDEAGKPICMLGSIRDITERKKIEEAHRESEGRIRAILSSSPDAIAVIDLNGNMVECNQATLELLGYSSKDELIGKSAFSLVAEEDRERVKKDLARLLSDNPTKNFECAALRKDGRKIQTEISSNVIRDSSGNPLGFAAVIRDVSERKKMVEALRLSEENWRSLAENAPNIILIVDRKGTIQFINRTVINASPEKIVGRSIHDFIDPEHHNTVTESIEQVFKTGEGRSYEISGVGPKGSVAWYRTHVGPIKHDGQVTSVTLITTDITEHKEMEEALGQSQQKFEQLFMGNPEAAVYVDPDERVLNVNPRFTELFGYSVGEVKGRFLDDFVVPEDRRKEALMLAQKGKAGYLYHETVRKNKKGSLIPVALSSSPIVLQDQHPGDIVLYKDITERKKAEKGVREAMEKLDVMNEKLRVVGGLTRHDVRNKLTAVTGNAYLAREKLPGNSEVLDYLKQIEASVEETVRIFEFAKAYEMLGAEELVYVDVEKTVNEAVSPFSGLKDIKVINDCHGLTVLADSLLRQLFYNLVDNSLKYGEKLSRIRVFCEEKNDHLKVIYEDDGVGIPEAVKSKLFDEGYTTGKGSGYGLFLIRKMMDVYGWTIQETGMPGKGAKFTIIIPRTNQNGKENYTLH